MRNLLTTFTLLSLFSATTLAISGKEFPETVKPEYPTKSMYHTNSTIQIKRYVVEQEENSYSVAKQVARNVGSDKNKKVHIIWANKSTEKFAKDLKKKLISLNIDSKQVHLERSKMKKDIYPLYVEIQQVAPKRANCRVNTVEDMMSFDPYVPCASQHNLQIQLKN